MLTSSDGCHSSALNQERPGAFLFRRPVLASCPVFGVRGMLLRGAGAVWGVLSAPDVLSWPLKSACNTPKYDTCSFTSVYKQEA